MKVPAGSARRHKPRRKEMYATHLSLLLKILGILDLLIKSILIILK
jgi:hypothetical protein